MDIFYQVDMSNQWRMGLGLLVDLNCGWYCQDALLSWYCKKNNLPANLFKRATRYSRMKCGFNPIDSYCYRVDIPKNIFEYRKYLINHGPIIASGKIGLANLGIFGGVEHYVLVVGVRIKKNEIIIYDPLSVDFRNFSKANPSIYNFNQFTIKVKESLILNNYSLKIFHIKYPPSIISILQ